MSANSDYAAFLAGKRVIATHVGFEVAEDDLNPMLYPFQRSIVRWALRRGRAALFCECGTGKTGMQLEWAWHVRQHTGGGVWLPGWIVTSQRVSRAVCSPGGAEAIRASGAAERTEAEAGTAYERGYTGLESDL